MSEQKNYIVGWFPDEKSEQEGVKRVSTCIDARDIEHAKAKANFTFLEEYEEAQSAAYKMLVCEDGPHIADRPVRGIWDTHYLYTYDWPEEVGYPILRDTGPVNFDKLSPQQRIAVLVKYDSTQINKSDLPAAYALLQDEIDTFEGHVVEAISRTPEIARMYPERIQHAIGWVGAKCEHTAKWPEIQKELWKWLKRIEENRKPSAPSKSIVEIAREKAAQEKMLPQADSSVSPERPKRAYKHTYQTLEQEVANALWPGDVNPGNVNGEIYRWAKREVIEKDREDWKRISMALRTTENILKYDALTIRDLVQMRPEDVHKNPVQLNEYISDFLAKNGVYENEAERDKADTTGTVDAPAPAAGPVEPECNGDGSDAGTVETAPQVETGRQGPFYYRAATGDKIGRANKLAKLQEMLSQGCIEISQEEYQARKKGNYKEDPAQTGSEDTLSPQNTPAPASPARPEPEEQNAGNEAGQIRHEIEVAAPQPDAFILRADELEKELSNSKNLALWKSVMRTNPRYTKDMGDLGFGGTSINAEYMVMRATEAFGPAGTGWGWTILEDKMVEGAPLTEKIFEGNKFVGKRILRDGDGTLLFELNHYLRIELWYIREGERRTIEGYGSTPYRQSTKNGVYCDSEVHKKSLTDAVKKCLSMLGFSADVWLGLYDDAAYKAESAVEFGIKDAADKAGDTVRLRKELDERIERNQGIIKSAVTPNEAKGVYSTIAREVDVYRKDARAKGDHEFDSYLKKRLLTLHKAVEEKIRTLESDELEEPAA